MDENLRGGTNPLNQSAGTAPTGEPMRPMQQAPAQEVADKKKKEKHVGRTIGIIIGILVLIGVCAGVAFAFLYKEDPVAKAADKIAKGETPEYVAVDGKIEFTPTESDSSIVSSISIDLKSQLSTKTLINTSSAEVTVTFGELGEASFTASEIYPSNGDLYFKIDNFKSSFEQYAEALETVGEVSTTLLGEGEALNTVKETVSDVAEPLIVANGAAEKINGQWLMLPLSDINTLFTDVFQMDDTSCVTSLTGDLKNSANKIAQLYSENAFVTSTTEGVNLASKKSEVRKVVFNEEKLNNFAKQLDSSSAITNYNKCTNSTLSMVEEIKNEKTPLIYVEVDENYNITRFFTEKKFDDANMKMSADLNLTYPSNINVVAPEKYTDLIESLKNALTDLVDNAIKDGVTAEDVEKAITTEATE